MDDEEKKEETAAEPEAAESAAAESAAAESAAAESAPEPASHLNWYVVRVQSGREEQVKNGLLRRVRAAGLETWITSVMVPTEKVTEIRSGRKAVREKKLYPGYIMIQMQQDTMLIDGAAKDIVYTAAFSGVPGSYLRASMLCL